MTINELVTPGHTIIMGERKNHLSLSTIARSEDANWRNLSIAAVGVDNGEYCRITGF
jgi:hypothetical protein